MGQPHTYEEIEQAVNVVVGPDLSDVWTRYAYGNEPIPLDRYFEDDDHDGLVNGLEAERRTDPELADTDGDGVDDGVEYAEECQQTAPMKDYCTETIPPGAKSVRPTPAAMPTSTPHPAAQYAPPPILAVDLAGAAIVPDGDPSDWGNRQPLVSSPTDQSAAQAGVDLSALYAFADDKYLYLRQDQHGGFPQPPLQDLTYVFDLNSPQCGDDHHKEETVARSRHAPGGALCLCPALAWRESPPRET